MILALAVCRTYRFVRGMDYHCGMDSLGDVGLMSNFHAITAIPDFSSAIDWRMASREASGSAIAGMPSAVALESVSALHRIRFRTQAAFLKRARRLARHIYHSIV